MKLSATNVREIFMNCLFTETESTEDYKIGEGIKIFVGFHPGRLKKNESLIVEILNELPDDFKKTGGGGMSFLNMCDDKEGNQWSDTHQTMDMLVTLGNAVGKISFLFSRDLWCKLPGGVPYIVFNNT